MTEIEAKIKIKTIENFAKIFEVTGKELIHIDAIRNVKEVIIKALKKKIEKDVFDDLF